MGRSKAEDPDKAKRRFESLGLKPADGTDAPGTPLYRWSGVEGSPPTPYCTLKYGRVETKVDQYAAPCILPSGESVLVPMGGEIGTYWKEMER